MDVSSAASNAPLAGEHLVEHAAKCPDVHPGAPINRFAPLACSGRHIRRRPHDHATSAGRGCCEGWGLTRIYLLVRYPGCLRQAKVQHLHSAVVFDLDVGGLPHFSPDGELLSTPASCDSFARAVRNLLRISAELRRVGSPRPSSAIRSASVGYPRRSSRTNRLLSLGFFQPVDVPDVGMVQRGAP